VEPEKKQRKKKNVGKVKVEPKTIGITATTPNHYISSRTAFSWQSYLFLSITSCHETKSSTDSIVAPANLLLPEWTSPVK